MRFWLPFSAGFGRKGRSRPRIVLPLAFRYYSCLAAGRRTRLEERLDGAREGGDIKMKPLPLANSLAVVMAGAWVVCALIIWILPEFSLYITKTWLMGLQGLTLTGWSLDFLTFLVGGIAAVVSAWVFGYAWGWLYQKLEK